MANLGIAPPLQCNQPQKIGRIELALGTLNKEIETLCDFVLATGEKFSSCLSSPRPSDGAEKPNQDTGCMLANAIYQLADRIAYQRSRLEDYIDRCEL